MDKSQPVNPPDKPGVYKVLTLVTDDDAAAEDLTELENQGFELVEFDGNRVILYKKG